MRLPDYDWLRERVIDSDEGRASIRKATQVAAVARELGMRPSQLAIAWCLKNPHVSTAILGVSRVEQLAENLEALDHVESLTDEVLQRLEGVLQNKPELPTQF